MASSLQKDKNGATTSETRYNNLGLTSSITGNSLGYAYIYDMTHDAKGNLTSVKLTQNGVEYYLQEFTYDDHENPENAIQKAFKGIPEPILTAQLTDGVNNLVKEKITNYQTKIVSESVSTYQYNAAGLPESSSTKNPADQQAIPITTAFRYKCQ